MSRVAGRSRDAVEIDGDMVRYLRTAARNAMSQEALARRVGVSSALIGHLETGYTRRVSRQIAESIAAALGISPEALLRGGDTDVHDGQISASLQRISALLDRLVDTGSGSPGGAASQLQDDGSELAVWATDFMRQNSRRAPPHPAIPSAEEVARFARHHKVAVGFDLTALSGELRTSTRADLFHGHPEVARALIDALKEGTSAAPHGTNRTVLLTYQGHDLFAVVEPRLRDELLQTLREALDRGWNVLHLLRYSTVARRYLDITSQAVELAGRKGRYVAKYLADDPDSSTEFDLMVIPDSSAMQLWSTETGKPADIALKLYDPAIERQMAAIFQKSVVAATELIDTYPQYTALLRVLLHPEQVPGHRYQIKAGPAPATVPKNLWRWSAQQVRESLVEGPETRGALDLVDQYERAMIKRGQLLDTGLQSHSSYDLMSAAALDDLVRGRYDSNDWLIARAQGMQPDGCVPPRLRVEHLERLISLLDRYEDYHLGIADPDSMDEPFPHNLLTVRVGIPLRGTCAAFVQVWPESRDGDREEGFFAVLRDPRIVDAFRGYFTELWDGPGVVRDRGRVREILRGKIRAVEHGDRAGFSRAKRRTPRSGGDVPY